MTQMNDAPRVRAAEEMADRLSQSLAVPPAPESDDDYSPNSPRWRHQSLSQGAAGIAVLHGLRARHGHPGEDRVHPWLARATQEDLNASSRAGLWFGAPALAFTITVAAPERYHRAATRLDAGATELIHARLALATARIEAVVRPSLSEFDLVHGLTGLGAYLLRRDPHSDLMGEVLHYLVRLTEPIAANDGIAVRAPGWWTNDAPAGQPIGRFAGGHANFGMAHGIAGPLALLALAVRHGITVNGQAAAIEVICDWLDTWRQASPTGPWWPRYIDVNELAAGHPTSQGRVDRPGAMGRPVWPEPSNLPVLPWVTRPTS
jgi:hypothetical protein